MKASLIALITCCAVSSAVFASQNPLSTRAVTPDDPGTNVPKLGALDDPGTNVPKIAPPDDPGTNVPKTAIVGRSGVNSARTI